MLQMMTHRRFFSLSLVVLLCTNLLSSVCCKPAGSSSSFLRELTEPRSPRSGGATARELAAQYRRRMYKYLYDPYPLDFHYRGLYWLSKSTYPIARFLISLYNCILMNAIKTGGIIMTK